MSSELAWTQAALLGIGVGVCAFKRASGRSNAKRTVLHVGGVPEHFNIPVHDALEGLADLGVEVKWADMTGGTGAMVAGLRDGSLDVVIALTEGLVTDLARGNPSKIVAHYVESPLRWGVHVAGESTYTTIADLEGKTFGVSRLGSGSHLMAYVLAQSQGWDSAALQFVVVGGLAQARDAMREGRIDAFMWEQFTTKPLVYAGEWRCVGICPTPWPCFAVAAGNQALLNKGHAVKVFVQEVLDRARDFKAQGGRAVCRVANDYGLKLEDAAEWFAMTEWAKDVHVRPAVLNDVVGILRAVGVLGEEGDDAQSFIHTFQPLPRRQ